MPNYVKNIVRFDGKPENIKAVLGYIHDDKNNRPITFDKIIPQPKTAEMCLKEYLWKEDCGVERDDKCPFLNWYKWNLDHWDTKWDAFDQELRDDGTLVFCTAWSFPENVLIKLTEIARLFEVNVTIESANEDYGDDYGYYHMIEGVTYYDSRGCFKKAKKVWKY